MSPRGNGYDNARAEAFFSTLKIALVYRHHFRDHDLGPRLVRGWIEAFFRRRRGSSIGYPSPVDFGKPEKTETLPAVHQVHFSRVIPVEKTEFCA